jgi:tetratricopeptide (TPR) repeat protein
MKRSLTNLQVVAACLIALALLPACRGPASRQPGLETQSLTLLEQKLLEVIEMEQVLDSAASQEDAQFSEIQRLFQRVAQEYNSIISRNPDHLESRLLYGKLLSRYGDNEGARNQFIIAAKIDPNVAVIHQQLCTYYAEENDYTRALAYALNAVEIEPGTAAYHFQLGQVLAAFRENFLAEGVFSEERLDTDMLDAFCTAKDLEPAELALQLRYGEAFYDVTNPDWELALAHWKTVILHPKLSQTEADAVRLHQAKCLIELGRSHEIPALARKIKTPAFQQSVQLLLGDSPPKQDN